ncbi:hypothetical protein VTK73DRAFT_1797 [Phialemonium thermophilum]|uniref:Uncharacterized protein n=1 Tax=Phialemonium thermophilum TaxID=223376 RepID=A0ABR3VSZ5_9PEZI
MDSPPYSKPSNQMIRSSLVLVRPTALTVQTLVRVALAWQERVALSWTVSSVGVEEELGSNNGKDNNTGHPRRRIDRWLP